MNESIRFSVQLPPRGLRRNSETSKHNWRAKLKDEYSEAVWCAARTMTPGAAAVHVMVREDHVPWEKAHLTLVWKHAGVAPDHDNALSSLKVLVDCIHTRGRRPLGIVVDDSPEHLTIELTTRKVAHRAEEGVDVSITRG